MPIFWNAESMSVGHPIIDLEHKYLFALINCVDMAIRLNDLKLMEDYIDQLLDYTEQHFNHEEKIQRKIHYPEFEAHKLEHRELLNNLNALKTKLIVQHMVEEVHQISDKTDKVLKRLDQVKTDDSAELAQEVTTLIQQWITEHVLGTDRKMQPYIEQARRK